jgi:hypothetical protein
MNSMHINVILKKDKQENIIFYILLCVMFNYLHYFIWCVKLYIYIYKVYLTFISKTIYTYNNDYDI